MEQRARTVLAAGVIAIFAGLALASTLDAPMRGVGGAVSVLGWAVTGYALHRLGRLGSR